MAVYPNYDLNSPYELAEEFLTQLNDSGCAEDSDEYSELKSDLIFEMWNNKCVSETYEPGSTFKILTAAAALEEGAVKVDDTFYCPGWYLERDSASRFPATAPPGMAQSPSREVCNNPATRR